MHYLLVSSCQLNMCKQWGSCLSLLQKLWAAFLCHFLSVNTLFHDNFENSRQRIGAAQNEDLKKMCSQTEGNVLMLIKKHIFVLKSNILLSRVELRAPIASVKWMFFPSTFDVNHIIIPK